MPSSGSSLATAARMVSLALAGLTAVVLAGCGGGSANASVYTFNRAQPSCRVHQAHAPSGDYTAPTGGGLASYNIDQAGFLQDYAPHVLQPYCDGKPATADDSAWASLYQQISATLPGANSSNLNRPDLSDP